MIFSETGRELWKILATPEGWTATPYRLEHEPSGTSWWIANGGFFFDGADANNNECIGLIERHILWRRAKRVVAGLRAARVRSKQQQIAAKLRQSSTTAK